MAKNFEYVPYEEYKPVMQRVESCIDKIFDEIPIDMGLFLLLEELMAIKALILM